MNAQILAAGFTCISAMLAFVCAPRQYRSDAGRAAFIWALSAVLAFLVPVKEGVFAALALALMIFAPKTAAGRVALYLAVFPALPSSYQVTIPFPGINYLIELNFAHVAAILLLPPAIFSRPLSKRVATAPALVAGLALVIAATSAATLPFTSVLRGYVQTTIELLFPLYAISRALRTNDDIDRALGGLFTSALMLMFITAMSTFKFWNYYTLLDANAWGKLFTETRFGFLRMYATLVHTLLGFALGCGAILAMYFGRKKMLKHHFAIAVTLGMWLGVFVTGSRGGYLSAISAGTLAWLLASAAAPMRGAIFFVMGVGALILAALILQGGEIQDEYGTFEYRAELLRTSFAQIEEFPFFGEPNFIENPRFAHLKQGEGIVDIVSAYLQIALGSGLVGLFVFVAANAIVILSALRTMKEVERRQPPAADAKTRIAVAMAMHIAFLLMIFTVSAVSYVWQYGYLIMGLVIACVRANDIRIAGDQRLAAPSAPLTQIQA